MRTYVANLDEEFVPGKSNVYTSAVSVPSVPEKFSAVSIARSKSPKVSKVGAILY